MPESTATASRRSLAAHLRAAYAALCREHATARRTEPQPAQRRRAPRQPGSGALTEARYGAWAAESGAPAADVQRAAHGGSWSEAKRAAGLRSCGAPTVAIAEADARHHLRRALSESAGSHGRAGCLSQAEYAAYADVTPGAPNLYAVVRCFGSWSQATAAIGASPRWHRHDAQSAAGREKLLDEVRAVADALGHAPSSREYNARRGPGAPDWNYLTRMFGGWNSALRAAGLEPAYKSRRERSA